MAVGNQADGGPLGDNAGKAKISSIDDAISAALRGNDTEASPEPETAEDTPETETDESAGDDTLGKDADEVSDESKVGDDGAPKALSAPHHWPDADKKAFAKLTREGQEISLKIAKNLEGGFTRKSQDLSDKARLADSVRGLIDEPTRHQLSQRGMDEVGYFRYLHSLQQNATQDPVGYIKWAMQNLRVRPEQILGTQTPTAPQAPAQAGATVQDDPLADLFADPRVPQLQAELAQFRQMFESQEQERQQRAYEAQQAEQSRQRQTAQAANDQIQSFRQAQDGNGHLQYPHFDAVRNQMAALMDGDAELASMPDGSDKLKAAYEMAVWSRPDLRSALVEAAAQKKVDEARKKSEAERAKKATGVKPSTGVGATRPKATTLDEAINMAATQLGR